MELVVEISGPAGDAAVPAEEDWTVSPGVPVAGTQDVGTASDGKEEG